MVSEIFYDAFFKELYDSQDLGSGRKTGKSRKGKKLEDAVEGSRMLSIAVEVLGVFLTELDIPVVAAEPFHVNGSCQFELDFNLSKKEIVHALKIMGKFQ
ncbi:uncharacterized protein RCO7_14334 [Rhynchosporium graminicola]|uniref:Uncharacterized protein n=1 Tax=Rhynchosporium graminicola TaxID=2792576 RepID=A0A1E1K9X1_9HELO|nr:uncharacterized protein RCO7_14334 [Rhynchosporium commune]